MPNDAIFEVVDSLSNDDLEIVAESPEQIMLLDNPYVFQFRFASKTTYGVVKIGDNIDVTNGVISFTGNSQGVFYDDDLPEEADRYHNLTYFAD